MVESGEYLKRDNGLHWQWRKMYGHKLLVIPLQGSHIKDFYDATNDDGCSINCSAIEYIPTKSLKDKYLCNATGDRFNCKTSKM